MKAKEKIKHENDIISLIQIKKLMRFSHVFGYYTGCSRATAYNNDLDKLDSIKEALSTNREKGVDYLLQKWIASDNATLQIAAMRLICTPEEHQKLNQQYIDHSSKDGSMSPRPNIIVKDVETGDAIDKLVNG